ncbi:MAG: SRPBCC family protein [Alphaproteobacteria bacterium]|nr:SRPBCC family protein [Alphaproteobacteria bacterium]
MINKLLAGLILIVLIFVGIALTKPDEMKVSRSAVINAPVAKIFPHINDLHKWDAWSPWAKLDPTATPTFSGATQGNGAVMAWTSEKPEVGTGKMTITESVTNQRIVFLLEFEKPMQGTNTAIFTFKPEGKGTNVTWSMSGKMGLIQKMMSIVMDCEKMVGGMFEEGLKNLKEVVEK